MSSWALLQEADVDLCREQVSILAVTPCDWSEVDADDLKKLTVYEAL